MSLNPCATITNRAQLKEKLDCLIKVMTTNDMWATDENAIKTFISVEWQHTILINTNPHKLILLRTIKISPVPAINSFILIKPNPPSFKRIAAKNIEPITGASTWALGSHM